MSAFYDKIGADGVPNQKSIIRVICSSLNFIDNRLTLHGERVAYIAEKIAENENIAPDFNRELLFILCVFHDIGAYKTEEIDRMLEFESTKIWEHSIYGYTFLKNMTFLGDAAESILYHHTPYKQLKKVKSEYKKYAELIHLSDRIDVLIQENMDNPDFEKIKSASGSVFSPKLVEMFFKNGKNRLILEGIKNNDFIAFYDRFNNNLSPDNEKSESLLKMLVYIIDFKSVQTVSHTINTITISEFLAECFNLSSDEKQKIYWGSLLHDIGKIAIPESILENPGRLTPEQMNTMRSHVVYTKKIISGLVDDEICDIATRHHEKLDGSGYPDGLTGKDTTFSQKIVTVADILSALTCNRSYKSAFPKEKVLSIITEMRDSGQLDKDICNTVIDNYDRIVAATSLADDPVINMYNTVSSEYNFLCKKFI